MHTLSNKNKHKEGFNPNITYKQYIALCLALQSNAQFTVDIIETFDFKFKESLQIIQRMYQTIQILHSIINNLVDLHTFSQTFIIISLAAVEQLLDILMKIASHWSKYAMQTCTAMHIHSKR